ncbi:eukaryotic translation initiation factor 2-alpha kinase, partial [Coemansia sp. RSA 1933]
ALDSASRGLTFELQRTAAAARATETKAVEPPNAAETRHASKRRPQQPQPQPQPQPAPKALVAVSEAVLQPSASRYRTDFEEVEFLGKGGFGSVVKARNRIDGRFYAIKKIKLDPRDNEGSKKIFREVTTLSRLHHQNIVRYYTTWVEDYDDSAAMAGGMGGILEESESMQSSDDESPGDISLGLSHSSWSTEQSISSSSSSSSSSDSDEQDAEPASDASDSLSESGVCFASPSRSESGNSSAGVGGGSERLYSDETTNDDALDALNPRVAGSDMLAPAKGRRTSNVFSAIRFGTMRTGGQDDAAARQSRAVTLKTYGPVREFAASATEDDEARSSSDGLGAMLVREQQAQQRHMLSARQKGKTPKKQKHPAAKRRRGQILYIQMEYCENKTLSDMIREGLDEKACWRLFGQILEGLHHIHERSVIHRDLKPVNAFLDGAGDVKIGDFGLATSSFAPMESAAAARVDGVERSGADEALTADIGTSLYVAPEVTAKSSGGAAMRYNQKVDMYSLGIIFFEMCYPLKTGMERATVLHNLRKPEIVFPADFAAERMQLQYQIIKRLLSHNPRLRPSSAELLESGLLPPKMDDDEYIRETIKTIANPSQPYFAKLLASLFARATDKHIDATFDYRANDVNTEQLHAVFLDRIRETMTRVFRTHAAVELSTPALAPRVDLLDTYQTPACYLDARGHVVQLPYDQTVPFARYVARTRMTEIKRYSFDRFFVANAAGGQPVSHSAAAFDAVTNRSAHAVAAAEVIAVVCEVFDALPPLRRMPMVLLVNHMAILDAVLAYCGILPAGESDNADALFVRNVCFCLSALYREKAHIVRQRIQVMSLTTGAKLHPHALDRLQPFMDIRGDLGTVQREVLARIGSECGMGGTAQAMRGAELARAAARAFSELRYVEATVRHFGVAVPIAYSPLFNHHYAYYEGAYAFQFMTEPATKSRVPHVLAIGGRYDGLLRRFRHLAGSYLPSETGDTKPHSNAAAAQTAPQPPQPPTDDDVAADAAAAAAASISFARRTGSLHSTDVWQQMYAKPGGSRGGSRAGKSYDDSVPVSIGTSLSDGSAALGTARDVVCVGVQIHLDRVIQEMARYQQKVLQTSATSATPTFGLWTRKRCDVVVASFGTHPLLKERISLARDLWANGLRTDFLFNDDPEMTMERLVEICSEQGMNWIVTLKRKPPPAAFVYKVKNILRRVECEVPRHALIDWLHTDIGEQLKLDLVAHDARGSASATSAAGASAGGGGASSTSRALREDGASGSTLMRAATTSGSSNTGNSGPTQGANTSNSGASAGDSDATGGGRLELTIVNPQFGSKNVSRSKHKQRLMLTDRAKTSVTRVISDVRGAPVLVIDLGPELLRRMAGEPSILSEAGYKRVMELCSAHQRAYVVELHSAMERHRREGCQYVWLYSVKGDYAVTYKL